MPSFDAVSDLDSHELTNAVDQANRELSQRFDFKDTGASYELKEKEFIRFVPNPNWRGPKAAAEEVIYRYISDSKVAFEAYKTGELDIVPLVPEDLESVLKDPVLSK